ncbi:MAG: pyridoxal phosphate-dependent aminotransferase [Micavibrio sp.]
MSQPPSFFPPAPAKFRSVLSALSPNPGAEMLRYGWTKPGILSLAQGEGSLATPDFIVEASHKALRDGKTFYAPVLGVPELRQELSTYYARHYGQPIPASRIFATSSGTTAMHLALTSILDEGDEIIAVTPIWKNLLGAIELTQAVGVQVPLEYNGESGKWALDMDRLFGAVTARTKAILLVTPSNPTGWTMSGPQIREVLDFARARGIWIVADEVYGRIVYDGTRSPSFLDHARPEDRLFVVNSFSKSYAMTGWRLGWLVGPPDSETPLRDLALYDNMGPPTYAQYGAIAAIRHGEEFIARQVEGWRKNRDLVVRRFAEHGRIIMPEPEATFYAFFKVEGEEDCMALVRRLIDEGNLSLAPGCAFGKNCRGWIRMCFAVSEEKMVEALDRLESVVPPA